MRVDPAIHFLAGHAEVLEAEGELLADRLLGRGKLVGRSREHDPHPAQQLRAGVWPGRVDAIDRDVAGQRRPNDPRDEPASRERQGRLARARPAGDADPFAGMHDEVDVARARALDGPGT